jgi:hypothetical protein
MLLVFCRDPLEPSGPDRSLEPEVAAIERLGLPSVLVDHDALVRGDDPARVVRPVPEPAEPIAAVSRGWMVTPPQYRVLYEALATKNIHLINDLDMIIEIGDGQVSGLPRESDADRLYEALDERWPERVGQSG